MRCDHTHMLPLVEHFAPRHRVVAMDLRGHGHSDKPVGSYDNAVLAEDAGVCSELGLHRPVGVGHSFGGSVLLYLATDTPEGLADLVLLATGVRTLAETQT